MLREEFPERRKGETDAPGGPNLTFAIQQRRREEVPEVRDPLYLFQGNQDTLYRIHCTNEPAELGQAVSSGCIRMRNFDAIDLYNRVHIGTPVVVI
jgi:lipoprotein-anchoring transpeptidase ErfK/SrfK